MTTVDADHLRAPDREIPDPVRPVYEAVDDLDVSALSVAERDELERVLAAALRATRRENERDLGIERRRRWDIDGPLMRAEIEDRLPRLQPRLVDHPSRLHGDGGKVYVSEPYELHLDAKMLRCLTALVGDGWRIRLGGRLAAHFPARTFAVSFSRRSGRARPGGGG